MHFQIDSGLSLPANVVPGVPRIEKDPRGGDVVIVPVRPYARDMGRCAGCGEHGRPYDRLGVRRWRYLDIGCVRLLLEHAPRRVTCAEHGVTVTMVPWARRKSAYTRDWIGNGVLDSFLEDESLFGEFLRAPVSEGGVEPLVVGPPHVVVEVAPQLLDRGVVVPVHELLLQ